MNLPRSSLRWLSILLTPLALFFVGASLWGSWTQPQFQPSLDLYQTNLLLHAAEWNPPRKSNSVQEDSVQKETVQKETWAMLQSALLGGKPFETALSQYQEVRDAASEALEQAQIQKLQSAEGTSPGPESALRSSTRRQSQQNAPQKQIEELQISLMELDLKLGLLQVRLGNVDAALDQWRAIAQGNQRDTLPTEGTGLRMGTSTLNSSREDIASTLTELWSEPPRWKRDSDRLIEQQLSGWFRFQALKRLYAVQSDETALNQLAALTARENTVSQQAFVKLVGIGVLPVVIALIGVGLLIVLLLQWLLLNAQNALWTRHSQEPWQTPWSLEVVWQVFVLGFFFTGQFLLGQVVVPVVFRVAGLNPTEWSGRLQAFSILVLYGVVALGSLAILYGIVRPYLAQLPRDWFSFQGKGWVGWGLGGYCVALPLVIAVSWVNQQIWQGQGGSNPLLSLALEGQDPITFLWFFLTAAVMAPLFEEFLFRGFLLASLTTYVPMWGAIALSGVGFALAHLSLSEILPLTVLGMVLGFVYTRSRNLLAPMLLHSLWNSGTLIGLFVLGSGAQ